MFSLVIKSGPLSGRRVELASQLVVGRDDVDLPVDDARVSRRHALFTLVDEALEVDDLTSSNGTWVNGERIAQVTRLRAGDVVEVGSTVFEVEFEPATTEQTEPEHGRPAIVLTQTTRTVSAGSSPGDEPAAAIALDRDELRPVTALFADLVGSTAIGELLPPEEVKALIGECVSRMARAVEQFGGSVDAFMGDGISAFFGLPEVHEDDPERAARAALQIVHVVGEHAREIESAWGITDFNVRVGINSGQVAVGAVGGAKRQSVGLGDTTNVAARLQSLAAAGSIAVGEATARQLSDQFVLEPLGDVSVKGRTEPVSLWRLERASRALEAAPLPLVGRDAELARLAVARDELLLGRGQVLLLLGDAGIGKTRLLSELRLLAGGSVTWLEGSCASYGTEFRLFPVVEALRNWLGLEEGAAPIAVRAKLRSKLEALLGSRIAEGLPQLESLLSVTLSEEPSASDEGYAREVRRACCAWIEALTDAGPVALVLEDFQWADPWTCALAQDLLEIVERAPLLLAASFRIASQSEGWRFRVSVMAEHPHRAIEIPLAPLPDVDASNLLSTLAPGLSEAAHAEVIGRAEGNPLFLEQLMRAVVEPGGDDQQRSWTLSRGATRPVPAALESLLLSRIDSLTASARQLAQTASIVGRNFSYSVLRGLHPGEFLGRDLSVLVRAGVIRERRRYPELEYSFAHGLLREAALSTLTRSSRRTLYRGVAAAFEELFADSLDEHLELLAHFYGRSDDLQKALEYLERAAEEAVRLKADFQAAELWRRAGKAAVELGDVEAEARIAARLRGTDA